MEGALYKWGGYLSGWSLKYFVLHSGTFSCYASKEERIKGDPAKLHLNMGLCEIAVDAYIATQWELRIPVDSKIWYLKTQTPTDRQKWIKALGSAKACLLDTSMLGYLPRPSQPAKPLQNVIEAIEKDNVSIDVSIDSTMCSSIDDRMNERQKAIGNDSLNNLLLSSDYHDTDSAKESDTLDDDSLSLIMLTQCVTAKSNIIELEKVLTSTKLKEDVSAFRRLLTQVEESMQDLLNSVKTAKMNSLDDSDATQEQMEELNEDKKQEESTINHTDIANAKTGLPVPVEQTEKINTFFSSCEVNFHDVNLSCVERSGVKLVPVETFLNACHWYVGFFDLFAGTILAPLRTDILGNIHKIRKASGSTAEVTLFLQEVVQSEISNKKHRGPDTATQALLWLTRALRVMCQFLKNVLQSSSETFKDPSSSLWTAYSKLLAKHHNWMVQRLFKVGLKMLPDFNTYACSMTSKESWDEAESSGDPMWRESISQQVIEQGIRYSNGMGVVVEIICTMFTLHEMEV